MELLAIQADRLLLARLDHSKEVYQDWVFLIKKKKKKTQDRLPQRELAKSRNKQNRKKGREDQGFQQWYLKDTNPWAKWW